jgi:hypothetical protein
MRGGSTRHCQCDCQCICELDNSSANFDRTDSNRTVDLSVVGYRFSPFVSIKSPGEDLCPTASGSKFVSHISWGRSSCEAFSLDGQAGMYPSPVVAHFGSKPLIVDLEQVLAARLKCDLDRALTPSPLAVVVALGWLVPRFLPRPLTPCIPSKQPPCLQTSRLCGFVCNSRAGPFLGA